MITTKSTRHMICSEVLTKRYNMVDLILTNSLFTSTN